MSKEKAKKEVITNTEAIQKLLDNWEKATKTPNILKDDIDRLFGKEEKKTVNK